MFRVNRSAHSNPLNEALRQLFYSGLSEEDAYRELTADTRFNNVARSIVQSTYAHLQSKKKIEDKNALAKYIDNTEKLCYSNVSVGCKKSERINWTQDRKFMINDRFFLVLHANIEDDLFHHLTLIDVFVNKTRFGFKLSF
jgi:hypothetical protein